MWFFFQMAGFAAPRRSPCREGPHSDQNLGTRLGGRTAQICETVAEIHTRYPKIVRYAGRRKSFDPVHLISERAKLCPFHSCAVWVLFTKLELTPLSVSWSQLCLLGFLFDVPLASSPEDRGEETYRGKVTKDVYSRESSLDEKSKESELGGKEHFRRITRMRYDDFYY